MKTILCYGDSNTYGYVPKTGGRYDHKTRWPGVLRSLLNQDTAPGEPAWWVVEEGLNGRTTCRDDPVEPFRNGLSTVTPILKSHKPVDVVAVMLGSNDFKRRFSPSPYDIAQGMLLLVRAIQHSESGPEDGAPKVLVICPPPFVEPATRVFDDMFDGALELSKKLPRYYRKTARETGSAFLNAGTVIQSSPMDGVHLEAAEHRKLACAIAGALAGDSCFLNGS
jgi:lysophospholipase L1-like esterase